MLLQSKSTSKLRIDLIVELQRTGFGNYIQKKCAYCQYYSSYNELHVLTGKKGLDGGTTKTRNGSG
jgi:hypothetical protein